MKSSCILRSMIGKRLIKYPAQVEILSGQPLSVKGPLGTLQLSLPSFVQVDLPDQQDPLAQKKLCKVSVRDPSDRKQKAMWGTARALISNMVEGVSEGYTVPLRFEGVGYRAALDNGKLSLRLGFSHPVIMDIPQGVNVTIPAPQRVILQGIDKQVITQFAASIRKWRKPEPYNQKGIFVGDETIKKKEGKKR